MMEHFWNLRLQSYPMVIRAAVIALLFVSCLRSPSPAVAQILGGPNPVPGLLLPNGNPTGPGNFQYPDGQSWSTIGAYSPARIAQLSDVTATLQAALQANSGGKQWTINSFNLAGDYQNLQYFAWAGGSYFTNDPTPIGTFVTLDANEDASNKQRLPAVYPNIGGAVMGLQYDGQDT